MCGLCLGEWIGMMVSLSMHHLYKTDNRILNLSGFYLFERLCVREHEQGVEEKLAQ